MQLADDATPLIDVARLAEAERDWVRMADGYAALRARFPDNILGYFGSTYALREIGHFDEADALLNLAKSRFPYDSIVFVEFARVAEARGDLSEMAERYSDVRTRFPDDWRGYTGGAQALRQSGQLAEAEALLEEGQRRSKDKVELFIDHGRLAEDKRDWRCLASRCAAMRERFPEHPWAYSRGAIALRGMSRFDEFEKLLSAAMRRFPDDLAVLGEYARVADDRQDWEQARDRCEAMLESFPDAAWGYIGGARALDALGHRGEAKALLEAGLARNPANTDLLEAYCWMAQLQRDWSEALIRWGRYRERYPDRTVCYFAASVASRDLARFDEADALILEGLTRHPEDSELLVNYAFVASSRKDWDAASRRWKGYLDRFPQDAVGYIHTSIVYRELARFDEADNVVLEGLSRFPDNAELIANFAWNANQRQDWPEAWRRWKTYRDNFPLDPLGHDQAMLVQRELDRIREDKRRSEIEIPQRDKHGVSEPAFTQEFPNDNLVSGAGRRQFCAGPTLSQPLPGCPPRLPYAASPARFTGIGDLANSASGVHEGEAPAPGRTIRGETSVTDSSRESSRTRSPEIANPATGLTGTPPKRMRPARTAAVVAFAVVCAFLFFRAATVGRGPVMSGVRGQNGLSPDGALSKSTPSGEQPPERPVPYRETDVSANTPVAAAADPTKETDREPAKELSTEPSPMGPTIADTAPLPTVMVADSTTEIGGRGIPGEDSLIPVSPTPTAALAAPETASPPGNTTTPPDPPPTTMLAGSAMLSSPLSIPAAAAGDVRRPTTQTTAPTLASVGYPVSPRPVGTTTSRVTSSLSPMVLSSLLQRGDVLLRQGDVVAARLFYERAAERGSGPGATSAGKTYDPRFLETIDARGLMSDVARAIGWYQMASDVLGDKEADERLKALTATPPQ